MKTILFAAALTLSGAALAQTDDEATAETETTTTATTQTTTTTGSMQTVAPGNQAPELDARGIPVVSDPAMAPAGANQPVAIAPGAQGVPNPNSAAAFATQPSTKTYPPCTRGVTDGCVQTYERGSRR